ncbi:MAG: AAA family ATPase [Candidatus Micrarchaeia archaeon]
MQARNPRSSVKESIATEIIRKEHKTPLTLYRFSSYISETVQNENFVDTLLIIATFLAFNAALPTYPYILDLVIIILLFYLTQKNSFLGLIALVFVLFPIAMYQVPALAWLYMFALSFSMIYGYMHYRTMLFGYLLFALAFSQLGFIIFIPTLILAVLTVGYKRGILMAIVVLLTIVAFSAISGINNSAYILYNGLSVHSMLVKSGVMSQFVFNNSTPTKSSTTILDFLPSMSAAYHIFANGTIINSLGDQFAAIAESLYFSLYYLIDVLIFPVAIFIIDAIAVSSRSKYRGTQASIAGIIFPLVYIGFSYNTISIYYAVLAMVSFAIAPALLYLLEFLNFKVVKSLDVRKQDIRMKFGEAFEDLSTGTSHETFDSIGNYDATKKEIKEAIITPIEQRGISKAYNIKPSKGILLFGPPGTGKTLMMRALANEIHGGFFLVKAPNLISAYPGETERAISKIFDTARKNAPCVLLFDEIDAIAKNRNMPDVDDTHKQSLSQLLVEIDGFVKLERVIVVGATNTPNLLDPALLRPGRLDKLIYMPLPDFNGRKKIFKIYLSKLPVSKDIDIDVLAENTERYSGADIKAVCESVAQMVGQDALAHHKILEVTQQDLLNVIAATKPSTSLAQLEEYNTFKIDYERSIHSEQRSTASKELGLDDVIGLDDAKKAIVEAVQIPLMHPDLIKRYDIKPINGLLLFGPPGTGKTLLMKAAASEMKGVTILQIDGTDIALNNSESAITQIKALFNRARENVPAIIFIDEIDGILPKREGASETAVQIMGAVLQEIDGLKEVSGIVVIAATNRPDALDPALLRPGRLDKLIYIRPPNNAERTAMFRYYLSKAPIQDIDFSKIAEETKGFTGADIASVCREAKTRALEESMKAGIETKIDMAMLEGIIKSTKPSAPDTTLSPYLSFLARYGKR